MISITSGRITYWDNLKGLLILLVVLGHFADPFAATWREYNSLYFFIYLFHMPMFVFVTGLFAKSVITRDGGFRVLRVVQFFVLFMIMYGGIFLIERFLRHQDVLFEPWSLRNVSWYLFACCVWYLSVPLLRKVKPLPLIAVLIAIALAAGYTQRIGDTMAISRVLCFAPFFWAGYFADPGAVSTKIVSLPSRPLLRTAAALLLATAFACAFLLPDQLLPFRGLLTARNSYAVLDGPAPYGALIRLAWYVVATVLGLCVLLLVPARKTVLSHLGMRTLPIYIWHAWVLRLLGTASFVPWVTGLAERSSIWALIPIPTAVIVCFLLSLRPFALLSDGVMRFGKRFSMKRMQRVLPALLLLVILVLVVPLSGCSGEEAPDNQVTTQAPTSEAVAVTQTTLEAGTTTSTLPATTTSLAKPSPPTDIPFELPLEGSTTYVMVATTAKAADGYAGGKLAPGEALTIIADDGESWIVTNGEVTGRVKSVSCMINLPDIIPSIVYYNSNSRSAVFTSSSKALPGVTGEQLYDARGFNEKLGRDEYFMPILYPMAAKIMAAQQAALENGETLILYESYRPSKTQKTVRNALSTLANKDPEVMKGINSGGWSKAWFIAQSISNHQRGIAIDVTLGEVVHTGVAEGRDFSYPYTEEFREYSMHTPMHELSSASASFAYPVSTRGGSKAWRDVPLSPNMNEHGKALRDYCTGAGLTPLASEWWHFDDWDAERYTPAGNTGAFYLEVP